MHKKTAEGKRGSLLTPATSSINYNPWSRRYVGEGGRIPIVGNRRESLIGKIHISTEILGNFLLTPLLNQPICPYMGYIGTVYVLL